MIGLEPVSRIRLGVTTDLTPALFAPSDTAPATGEASEPVVPAPTLYWFNEWPDVVDTDRIIVRGVTYEVFTNPADWRGGVGGLVVRLRTDQLTALAAARADAVSRFTETFTAFTTELVLDPNTGAHTDVETPIYTGVAGSIKFPTMTVSEPEQAGQVPAVQDVEVHVAVGATPNAAVGVSWRITGSTVDTSLIGRVFRTKGLPQAGFVSAHRYPVEVVS